MPPQVKTREVYDFFVYVRTITFTALAQVLTDAIPIQADADFELLKITYTSSDATDPQTLVQGGGRLLIVDQADQRQLMSDAVPLDSIAGRAQRPYILPYPHRFRRNGTLGIQLTNTGLATQSVRLSLHGRKAWTIVDV